jgi:hypothetical protein
MIIFVMYRVKVVFIMARIHPGEAPASFVIQVRVRVQYCMHQLKIFEILYYSEIFQNTFFLSDQMCLIISRLQGLVDFLVSSHEVAQALRKNLQLSKP